MRVRCAVVKEEAARLKPEASNAVVIDVLRASSTTVTALAHGAVAVVPAASVEEALQIAAPGDVVAGEQGGLRAPGCELGNSPAEFTAEHVEGRRIVLATTNGTRALRLLNEARRLFVGCFLNAGATVRALQADGGDVLLVCAGTDGVFAFDDFVCAGLFATILGAGGARLHDGALAARAAYLYYAGCEAEALAASYHGAHLGRLGFAEDVAFCATVDRFDVVAEKRDGAPPEVRSR